MIKNLKINLNLNSNKLSIKLILYINPQIKYMEVIMMTFKELYKIVNKVDRILRYREPQQIIIDKNSIILIYTRGINDIIYQGDTNNFKDILEALEVIEELIPLIKNIGL